MADTKETLIDFVTTNYTSLLSSVKKTDDDEINKVIVLIDELFKTFKKPDSKHDEIVSQLKGLQDAYAGLRLNKGDYPRYAAAPANLTTIVVALKEDGVSSGLKVDEKK
jgi:hypothetical protein